jgi:hypothetical protein
MPRFVSPSTLLPGLKRLWLAFQYAQDAEVDVWELAVGIKDLRKLGMTTSDLQWLVAKGYAKHAEETTEYGDEFRSFRPGHGLTFIKSTDFVLTCSGTDLCRACCEIFAFADCCTATPQGNEGLDLIAPLTPPIKQALPVFNPTDLSNLQRPLPNWDVNLRELRLAEALVKRFRVPAASQEIILSVFQEEGWPAQIDDPLPSSPDIIPQRRLHYAINGLNRNQKNQLLRFHGNGNGNGVNWEYVAARTG